MKTCNESGSLSMTALWMLAILGLLLMGLNRDSLLELRLDNYALRSSEAVWLARAGVEHAIAVLNSDPNADSLATYDSFAETWANSPLVFSKIPCGSGFFEIAYKDGLDYQGIRHFYGLLDENRKINLNRAPAEVLARLPGMTDEKLAAFLDWRDADDETRMGGAENAYYQALPQPYAGKNGPLDFLEQVALVRDLTPEDVANWSPLVTVYGDGRVNINTAPVEVLRVLGISQELAQKIARARWGEDAVPLTQDDVSFSNPNDIVRELMKYLKLQPEDQMLLSRLVTSQLLGVSSSHFTIFAIGVSMNQQVRYKISATVRRNTGRHVEIVSWTEGIQ